MQMGDWTRVATVSVTSANQGVAQTTDNKNMLLLFMDSPDIQDENNWVRK